jgi:hypothetical protein
MNLPLDPAALAAILFVAVALFLLVYSVRHWSNRRKKMAELMPALGYMPIDDPDPKDFLPELLFHPNGFPLSSKEGLSRGEWQDVRALVQSAWRGNLAGHEVQVLDISVQRFLHLRPGEHHDGATAHQVNVTVLRCQPSHDPGPPDFLVEERVLFKSKVRGAVAIGGRDVLGEHYFTFSDASGSELEPWLNGGTCDQLGRHRLWRIAAHDGVLYLTRSSSWQKPDRMQGFLDEAEALLSCMLAAHR